MNKIITSREAILCAGKEIVMESGIHGLNMRDVATKCGVSVGSIYNYFSSKGDLIVATIESVWKEIMFDSKECPELSFVENIQSLFQTVQKGSLKYPAFFNVHPMNLAGADKGKGRDAMNRYFMHIKNGLLKSLEHDENLKPEAFSKTFTKDDFIDFVFMNILALLSKNASSCEILLEIIKRIIYI